MRPALLAAAFALIVAAAVGTASRAAAADADAESGREVAREAYSLSRDLMSPYCPGRTLADCPSPSAAAVRQEIRERMRAGESAERVRADLELRFGDAVIGVPRSTIGWVIPGLLIAAGGVLVVFALRRMSRGGDPEPPPLDPDGELERELDAEIARRGL
jgi:cytochrome c-type biogenesis protein CcmH/NrfF